MNNRHDEGRGAGVRASGQMNEIKSFLKQFSLLEAANVNTNHKSALRWVGQGSLEAPKK